MKRVLLIAAFIYLFLIPLSSAIDTNITLYTLPFHEVTFFVLDPGETYNSLQSYIYRTGFDGKINVLFTGDKSELGVQVLIKKDDKKVFYERLKNIPAGGNITLYVLVNESDVLSSNNFSAQENVKTNLEANNVSNLNVSISTSLSPLDETSSRQEKSVFEGLSIKSLLSGKYNYFLWASVFVLIVLLILMIFYKRGNNLSKGEYYTDNKPPIVFYDKELEAAERKIKQAQKEIQDIKARSARLTEPQKRPLVEKSREDRFAEAQRKFDEAKKELESLRQEKNNAQNTGQFGSQSNPEQRDNKFNVL
ncbi:MAG: hypothetical protein QXI33_01685 [Candidatus Pacearchaeota archaeon]